MAIDPEMRAFIEASERFYPADAATRPVAEQRALYDDYARAFALERPAGVRSEDGALAVEGRTIPLRRYAVPGREPIGTILYAHGGGFMLGSLDSHDGIVARLASATGADAVAIDYRLAPEHPYPAPLDDVEAAVRAAAGGAPPWADLPGRPLVLAGDSAGGTLMASAALRLAGSVPLAGLALVYPALGFEPAEPARTAEAEAPMLTLDDVRFYRSVYLGHDGPAPGAFPLDAARVEGLPRTAILVAQHDPLRDDGAAFAARLSEAGIPAEVEVARGLVHGFLRATDRSAAAARAFRWLAGRIAAFMRG